MFKKILLCIAVLSVSFSVVAQNIEGVNARLDAIAGSGPCTDIGWTIDKPDGLYNFPNQVQGTAVLMDIPGIGVTYGAIIGIVRFNEALYAGVTLNNRNQMPGFFYEYGAAFMYPNFIVGTDNASGFPNLPHVNLCVKINDNFKFGLGGFFEASSWGHNQTMKYTYTPASGGDMIAEYSYDHDKTVRDHGVYGGARITIGGFTINPRAKVGFPMISGTETSDQLTQIRSNLSVSPASVAPAESFSDIDYTFESPEGLQLWGGSNFWGGENTFFIGGVFYSSTHYQFNKITNSTTATLNADGSIATSSSIVDQDSMVSDIESQSVEWWFAFQPSFSDELYFAPEYDGGYGWVAGKDPDTDPDSTFYKTYHSFRLGIEKPIRKLRFFDEFTPRFGISAQWNKEWRNIKNSIDTLSVDDESIPWKSFFWGSDFTKRESKITCGIGLKKARGTLDISCDLLSWDGQGILTGPAAALATITVDFGKKYSSAESVETPAPAPEPVEPVSDEEPAVEPELIPEAVE